MTTTAVPNPTPEEINEIVRTFGESDLEYLLLELPGARIELSKLDGAALGGGAARVHSTTPPSVAQSSSVRTQTAPPAAMAESAAEASTPRSSDAAEPTSRARDVQATAGAVIAPALGVFYRRPSPDSPPYVEVGTVVGPDTPVATLEVMKMFTEVRAGVSGVITEILVENEDMVEKGQPLMRVASQ